MARSPQDVFSAHTTALASGDIGKIVEDYSAEAVLLTPQGPIEGRDGIGEFFAGALAPRQAGSIASPAGNRKTPSRTHHTTSSRMWLYTAGPPSVVPGTQALSLSHWSG